MNKATNADKIQRDLQTKLQQLIELQSVASTYQQIIEANTLVLSEIIRTKQALKDMIKLGEGKISGLINLGGGVFVEGEIVIGGRILVDVGAGIAIPVSIEEAIEKLSFKEKQVKESIENAKQIIMQIQRTISQLQNEINKLREQLK